VFHFTLIQTAGLHLTERHPCFVIAEVSRKQVNCLWKIGNVPFNSTFRLRTHIGNAKLLKRDILNKWRLEQHSRYGEKLL